MTSINNRIPKIIHYCWFGGNPLPEMAIKCITSWKRYCPDYEIIEWNEKNFDVNMNSYVKEAYESKKWAFVSDVARLYALVNYGGIYMDTDVEVIKLLDSLLEYEAVTGFESEAQILTGLMACEKGHRLFCEFLEDYDKAHFIRADGTIDLMTNVSRITNICSKYGLVQNNTKQVVNGLTLLPRDYLCPKDHETKEVHITKNTLCIHHFDGSWHTEEDNYVLKLSKRWRKYPYGTYVAKFIGAVRFRGIKRAVKETRSWLDRKIK